MKTGGRLQTWVMAGDGAGGESSAAKFKRQMEERVTVRKRRGGSLPDYSGNHSVTPQSLPVVPNTPQLPHSPPHQLPPQAAPPNSVVAKIAESVG